MRGASHAKQQQAIDGYAHGRQSPAFHMDRTMSPIATGAAASSHRAMMSSSPAPMSPNAMPTRSMSSPVLPSHSERRANSKHRRTSLEPVMESEMKMSRSAAVTIAREAPHPVEALLPPTRTPSKKWKDGSRLSKRPDGMKQRSQHFEDAFQTRGSHSSMDRVRGEAMVVAEVKTNVRVHDEYAFVNELSYYLSARYSRSVDSIIVTLQHGICMTFADSTRPAYTVVISALPSQVQPAMNKRNIVLIQRYFEQMLKIPASRGFVRFVATAEECCGCNMRTVASEIAEYTSPDADDGRGPRPAKSMSLRRAATTGGIPSDSRTPATASKGGAQHSSSPSPTPTNTSSEKSIGDLRKSNSLRAKKSFIQGLFFRSSKLESEAQSRTHSFGV